MGFLAPLKLLAQFTQFLFRNSLNTCRLFTLISKNLSAVIRYDISFYSLPFLLK